MSLLFSPFQLRNITLPNRIVVSPMCQYSCTDGIPGRWHDIHVGKLAQGGAGTVMLEATAVEARGRITPGDLGIWTDAHGKALAPLVDIIREYGAVPAIQIGHAGRKASAQRPWHGNLALSEVDQRERGEAAWPTVAPSAIALDEGWPTPAALDEAGLTQVADAFEAGAVRAASAGFRMVELHMAHGYLLHSFLSPLSNQRNDAYGGSLEARMRFPLEIARRVRSALGPDIALSARLSSVDGLEGGWMLEDSIRFARELKNMGVDVVDCSSGGLTGSATNASSKLAVPRGPGFQVPYAEAIRSGADIPTMAVGLITDAQQAEAILQEGKADLIAIGRQALYEPNWPHHAALDLQRQDAWEHWPEQYGWWLARRKGALPARSA